MSTILSAPSVEVQPTERAKSTRLAILVLYVLAPFIGEVISNSTPIAVVLANPIQFLYEMGLYGSGAVLIRELARRRGLGWGSILFFGAAYGILEEGLVVTSWFNPYFGDVCNAAGIGLCNYSRIFSINTIWALQLTAYHAVVSIVTPIFLTELFFPRIASRSWLGRKGTITSTICLISVSGLGLFFFGFLLDKKQGYAPPPGPYLFALSVAIALVIGGLRLSSGNVESLSGETKSPPNLWLLRFLGFISPIIYFLVPALFQGNAIPAVFAFLAYSLVLIGSFLLVQHWSRLSGWNARHVLALLSGLLGFFLLVEAPILESQGQINGKPTHGAVIVSLICLIILILLARRVDSQQRARIS
jgi:hypothetical protein